MSLAEWVNECVELASRLGTKWGEVSAFKALRTTQDMSALKIYLQIEGKTVEKKEV